MDEIAEGRGIKDGHVGLQENTAAPRAVLPGLGGTNRS